MAKSLCLRHPGHGLELVLGHTTSAGEQVASWALGAAIIKTLHQIGAVSMDKASLFPVRPVMFVDGDDPSKKPVVMSLVAKLGFEPVDAGPCGLRASSNPMACCIDQAINRGRGQNFAFAMTTRSGAA